MVGLGLAYCRLEVSLLPRLFCDTHCTSHSPRREKNFDWLTHTVWAVIVWTCVLHSFSFSFIRVSMLFA